MLLLRALLGVDAILCGLLRAPVHFGGLNRCFGGVRSFGLNSGCHDVAYGYTCVYCTLYLYSALVHELD